LKLALSASEDSTLKVWDVKTGHELRTLQGHSHYVNKGSLSADGRLALSASRDKILKIWDVETGALIVTFTCDAEVHSCAFITNDKFIAGDAGGHVHLLSLEEPQRKN
jgi:WD40 repeat protein